MTTNKKLRVTAQRCALECGEGRIQLTVNSGTLTNVGFPCVSTISRDKFYNKK
jgi:hypothetical protein